MTYAANRDQLSRQPLNIVELDLDTTITTGGTEYLCDGLVPHGQLFWPCVTSIEWVPTKASVDGGIGYLGEVVVNCQDFAWTDGVGTYFGRLLANNPYYLNRALKIHVGFHDFGDTFSFSDTQERLYFIKKITGPDNKGRVKIEASDVLSLLKESQVPAASYGNLNSSLTDSATGSTNIGDNTGFSASGGYALINSEIVAYSGISGGDSITISARGQGGTTAAAHEADDPVREVYYYSGNVVDCIRDIIENFSEVDHATYLPDTDWNTQRDDFLSGDNVECWVLEPTELDEVIDDLGKQTYTNVWWDDSAQEIKLQAIGPTLTSSTAWSDANNILDDRVSLKRDQRDIVTQVWFYYGKLDPTEGDNPEKYERLYVAIDNDAETGLGQPKIKKIFAKHVPDTGSATASKVASRIISQFSTPIEMRLLVDAKDSDLEVNQPVDITTDLIQGTDGLPTTTKLRVIEKAHKGNNQYEYGLVYSGIEQGNQYCVIAPNSVLDYDSASTAEKLKYGWIADGSDLVGTANDDPYLIL